MEKAKFRLLLLSTFLIGCLIGSLIPIPAPKPEVKKQAINEAWQKENEALMRAEADELFERLHLLPYGN